MNLTRMGKWPSHQCCAIWQPKGYGRMMWILKELCRLLTVDVVVVCCYTRVPVCSMVCHAIALWQCIARWFHHASNIMKG